MKESKKLFEIDINFRNIRYGFLTEETTFSQQQLEEASSMVIAPLFVKWDEEFIPKKLLKNGQPDWSSDEIIGRPIKVRVVTVFYGMESTTVADSMLVIING